MNRDELDALIEEANQLYEMGKLNDALEGYRDALAVDPTRAWAHSRVGAILAQLGDEAGAEDALKQAIELDPTLPQAHSNLGNIYYARGQYDAALAKYKEAVALSPNTAVFHENLHAAYKKLGKVTDAVGALKQAHRLEREETKAEAKAKLEKVKKGVRGRFGCLSVLTVFLVTSLFLSLV